MKRILELEFDDDATLDDIYEELMNCKKQGILSICKHKGILLSNENENVLKSLIDRLKLNMTETEYSNSIEEEKNKMLDYSILATMITAPKVLRYYVERGAIFITEQSKEDDFVLECYYWYGKNNKHFKSIKIASELLEVLHSIDCGDIDKGNQLVENMMNRLSIDDDLFIDTAEIIVKSVIGNNIKELEKLLLKPNAEKSRNQYEHSLKMKYPKNTNN